MSLAMLATTMVRESRLQPRRTLKIDGLADDFHTTRSNISATPPPESPRLTYSSIEDRESHFELATGGPEHLIEPLVEETPFVASHAAQAPINVLTGNHHPITALYPRLPDEVPVAPVVTESQQSDVPSEVPTELAATQEAQPSQDAQRSAGPPRARPLGPSSTAPPQGSGNAFGLPPPLERASTQPLLEKTVSCVSMVGSRANF